jgi:hypothetical protein
VRLFATCAALALVLASGAGAASGKQKPYKPSARDRAAAHTFAVAAGDFLQAIDNVEGQALAAVKNDYLVCTADYSTKVDTTRLEAVETFLAGARALPGIPSLWRAMLARWDGAHPGDRYLKLIAATAHGQAGQVTKLGQGTPPGSICDVLAGWESSGWASTYVDDLERAWYDSVPVDSASMDAARNKVSALAPQLRKLGLANSQISDIVVAVL